jgi:glutamine synthetase
MALNCQNSGDVMKAIKDNGVQMVSFRFIDVPGITQNFTIPVRAMEEDMFDDGLGFDGSSVRGFQKIEQSDMLVMPDPSTAFIDPFFEEPTLVLTCNIKDPISGEMYTRDPRYIAMKAEDYLQSTGIADTAYFGPEAEFFVFDDVRYGQGVNEGFYRVDSEEGNWNTGLNAWDINGSKSNLGYKARPKGGYFPVPPTDKLQDMRTEMVLLMEEIGLTVEAHHHEVGTGGQCEIDMRFGPMRQMADHLMLYKYVVRNVAYKAGKTATFMPKPLFEDNGSGMHCHQSLWKNGEPLFFDANNYGMLSDIARWYVGGILTHASSILAFAAPTTNSYRRLVPGYEAPIFLVMSQRNRSAAVRIPTYSPSPKARRIEFRAPDPSANPYLAFSAMLMAGLDGIQNKIEPPEPMDLDFYELGAEEAAKINSTPGSLDAVLNALEADHDYLMKGDVFTGDFLETYIDYKRAEEVDPIRLRPHPYEFFLYYDI